MRKKLGAEKESSWGYQDKDNYVIAINTETLSEKTRTFLMKMKKSIDNNDLKEPAVLVC